mgnify:CR=1 FL=1
MALLVKSPNRIATADRTSRSARLPGSEPAARSRRTSTSGPTSVRASTRCRYRPTDPSTRVAVWYSQFLQPARACAEFHRRGERVHVVKGMPAAPKRRRRRLTSTLSGGPRRWRQRAARRNRVTPQAARFGRAARCAAFAPTPALRIRRSAPRHGSMSTLDSFQGSPGCSTARGCRNGSTAVPCPVIGARRRRGRSSRRCVRSRCRRRRRRHSCSSTTSSARPLPPRPWFMCCGRPNFCRSRKGSSSSRWDSRRCRPAPRFQGWVATRERVRSVGSAGHAASGSSVPARR